MRLPTLLLLLAVGPALAQNTVTLDAPADLARHIAPFDAGTLVVLDPAAHRTVRVDAERAGERLTPASTFKIPPTLCALDAGALSGPDDGMAWDPEEHPSQPWWPEAWRRDHTLASAVEHSVVWFFRETAERLGPLPEQACLDALGYGNRTIGADPTLFWLDGSLRVSAEEQVAFLQHLWDGSLPPSEEAQATTRALVPVLRVGDGWRLLGKTGTATDDPSDPDATALYWLVGVFEREGESPVFYALNFEGESGLGAERVRVAEAALRDLGYLLAE